MNPRIGRRIDWGLDKLSECRRGLARSSPAKDGLRRMYTVRNGVRACVYTPVDTGTHGPLNGLRYDTLNSIYSRLSRSGFRIAISEGPVLSLPASSYALHCLVAHAVCRNRSGRCRS